MKTSLDENLRERWAAAEAGARQLEQARAELERRHREDDGGEVARSHLGRALQRLSEACRLSGRLDEALRHKDATIMIWEELGKHRAMFLVHLQRALVLAELGDEAAERQMARLGEQLRGDPALEPFYTDFWLEYEARRLYWRGDLDAAREHLEAALRFRRQHRAERIVRWTEDALRKLECGDECV